jgi:hypothetical protein
LLAKPLLNSLDVAVVVHDPEQLADKCGEAIWQPVDGTKIEYSKPPVPH